MMDCRVGTLVKIADSLGVNLLDVINSSLEAPVEYNFINSEIKIDSTDLPKALKNTIKELEEYDRNNDTMFYECADMLYMMADRFLKDARKGYRACNLIPQIWKRYSYPECPV